MRRLLAALCAALLLALTACTPRSQTPERHELTYLDVFDTVSYTHLTLPMTPYV